MLNYFVCICAERSDKITSVYHPTNMSNRKSSTSAVLTVRESEWLRYFLKGYAPESIAMRMKVTHWTARWYKIRVKKKWNIESTNDAALVWESLRRGVVEWDNQVHNYVLHK